MLAMHKKLHLKGWSEHEIKKAEEIISRAEKNKHPSIKKVENSLYWFTLITGIIGTVLFSLVLIPILLVNNNYWSYVLTGVFGLLMGGIIIIIIKDLHWLEHHHHLFISLLIPVVALFNFFIIVSRVNDIGNQAGLKSYHDPILVGLVYMACFVIPYAAFLLIRRLMK